MALLRQCLQEVRMRHHEWDIHAADWPAPAQPLPASVTEYHLNHWHDAGAHGEWPPLAVAADQRHLG